MAVRQLQVLSRKTEYCQFRQLSKLQYGKEREEPETYSTSLQCTEYDRAVYHASGKTGRQYCGSDKQEQGEPLVLQGQVEATEIRISGKLPGRVDSFLVQEGDWVKAGDYACRHQTAPPSKPNTA